MTNVIKNFLALINPRYPEKKRESKKKEQILCIKIEIL